jgi:hypothetical protein
MRSGNSMVGSLIEGWVTKNNVRHILSPSPRNGTHTSKFPFSFLICGKPKPCVLVAEIAGISAPVFFMTLFAIEAKFWKLVPNIAEPISLIIGGMNPVQKIFMLPIY